MDVVQTEKTVELVSNVTSTQPIVTPSVAVMVSYISLPYIHCIGSTHIDSQNSGQMRAG